MDVCRGIVPRTMRGLGCTSWRKRRPSGLDA
jgi:hypothetical protein